jgi:acetylornithine deacetylase
LRELVAISTPSSVSNLPLLRWVAGFLEERGWRIELLPYQDEPGIEKANLTAWPGALDRAPHIDLAFVCHTDTVPYAANWAAALVLEQRDGQLHGCGSCDVKGALACFLAAVSMLDAKAISPSLALILTADEEIGCKGMERLLASTRLSIGSAIVSEPTSLRAGVAGKGYGLARIAVEGREAHSAFPRQGVSAISVAARLIVSIEDAFRVGKDGVDPAGQIDPLFDPPHTTLNIGVIEGGTAKNIIPGKCSFLVEWRSIPGDPPGRVLDLLHALAAEAEVAEPRAAIRVEALRAEPGFAPSFASGFAPAAQGNLQHRLADLLGGEPIGISFGSEASRLSRIAEEVIVIGPGDMRTAHSDRECVPIAELELWTKTLMRLMRKSATDELSSEQSRNATAFSLQVLTENAMQSGDFLKKSPPRTQLKSKYMK